MKTARKFGTLFDPDYWPDARNKVDEIDALIEEFNAKTGLLEKL